MNQIIEYTKNLWFQQKTHVSPSGWVSANAVCCEYRNESRDTRGRGGIKFDESIISYSCFNCGYRASYQVGRTLNFKFQQLMKWLGAEESIITKFRLDSLKYDNEFSERDYESTKIIAEELPDGSEIITENNYPRHFNYLKSREITIDHYPLYATKDPGDADYNKRIIVPFIKQNTIIGYSARSIYPMSKNRFIMKKNAEYVFGIEFQKDNTWTFLSEGLFDALTIQGLGVLHNEISDGQLDIINRLKQKIIVVPQLDKTGLKIDDKSLIQTALDNGWHVAFPEWKEKDINLAAIKYGKLFVTKHLLNQSTNNTTKIKIQQKIIEHRL